MSDKIYNVNATEKMLRELIMCRWGDLDNLAGAACSNDTTEEMIERLSKARGLLNTIQYYVEALQGDYGAEEEEGAIQIDDTVYDGDEELERHDRMFNGKEAGDEQ